MAKIEHVALWVDDLEKMRGFYGHYFGASNNDKYHNASKGFSSYFLTFEGGARLEMMHSTALDLPADAAGQQRCGWTHLALSVGSQQRVNELRVQTYSAVAGRRL